MAYSDDEDYVPPDVVAPPPAPGGAPAPGGGGGASAPPGDPLQQATTRGGRGGGGAPERPTFSFPGLPGFVAPGFTAPTMAAALAEPGYNFRLQAGQDALQRSAAARGLLRSGGTLKDLIEYGQKFGQQEYSGVYNRALQEFDRKYQGAKDMYAPQLARWNKMADAEIQAGLAAFGRRGGGGGGGGGLPPLDVILGPPPAPPQWAQMSSATFAPPTAGVTGAPGAGPFDDERDYSPF